ncbi:BTAD domain-containing putative transcriptional regulator [Streptomyces sp. CSMPJR101]|uniref:BTAD domain-containing putative transcriptional regulator n=1 Tax=Streptomyces sp. CSMPJR101 TaxID=1279378 RepID=UPI003853CC39
MPADPLPRRARYERGAARVFSPDGEPVGAGFLVDEGLLCTCAHVVAEPDGSPPPGPVEVDFPLLSGAVPGPRVTAEVESWRPDDDVALLRLKAPVDGAEPLPTADGSDGEWDRDIRAFGFPPQVPRGVNATGTLRGRQRADLIQVDLDAPGVRIGPGFSGAAVWDPANEVVVGMLTLRGKGPLDGTAYLLAADRLVGPDVLGCPSRELVIAEGETVRVSDALTSDWQQAHDALAHPDWPHTPTLKADLELLQLPLLVDVDSPWVEEHQRTWDQRRFYALREAGEILLAGKRLREAVEIAESLVNWEPLDEPSHLLLISAHMKLGAAGRSTELYQEFRRRLRKELGVEPAFELAHVAALAG